MRPRLASLDFADTPLVDVETGSDLVLTVFSTSQKQLYDSDVGIRKVRGTALHVSSPLLGAKERLTDTGDGKNFPLRHRFAFHSAPPEMGNFGRPAWQGWFPESSQELDDTFDRESRVGMAISTLLFQCRSLQLQAVGRRTYALGTQSIWRDRLDAC